MNEHYQSSIPADAKERVAVVCADDALKRIDYVVDNEVVGYRIFSEDGQMLREQALRNGKPHGFEYDWYENGVLQFTCPWVDGVEHGTAQQWASNGKLMGTYTMNQGTGIDLWWSERFHGVPEITGTNPFYLAEVWCRTSGRLHGYNWWLNEDQRTVYRETHFRNGQSHGIERAWNEHGRLRRGHPIYYIDGEKVDKRKYVRACKRDSTLPKFQEEENRPAREFPAEIAPHLRF